MAIGVDASATQSGHMHTIDARPIAVMNYGKSYFLSFLRWRFRNNGIDLRCIHCSVHVWAATFVESTPFMPLKHCITEFRFCLNCRHFTVMRGKGLCVYDCRKTNITVSFLSTRTLSLRLHTDTIPAARRNSPPFFPSFETFFQRQNCTRILTKTRNENDGKRNINRNCRRPAIN